MLCSVCVKYIVILLCLPSNTSCSVDKDNFLISSSERGGSAIFYINFDLVILVTF